MYKISPACQSLTQLYLLLKTLLVETKLPIGSAHSLQEACLNASAKGEHVMGMEEKGH